MSLIRFMMELADFLVVGMKIGTGMGIGMKIGYGVGVAHIATGDGTNSGIGTGKIACFVTSSPSPAERRRNE